MTPPTGLGDIDLVLFDLDEVLVPTQTFLRWQWAWRPNGPRLSEGRVRTAVQRELKAWDRRRWAGLVGREPAADPGALHQHLAATLWAIAGHPLPAEETDAVVRRVLKPVDMPENYPDALPVLGRLGTAGCRTGVLTPLPRESAEWHLKRSGLPSDLVRVSAGDYPDAYPPAREAFQLAVERSGGTLEHAAYVGDLFWSDVHAARRAGLRAVLIDRRGLWPKVTAGKIRSLDELETALANPMPTGPEPEGPE